MQGYLGSHLLTDSLPISSRISDAESLGLGNQRQKGAKYLFYLFYNLALESLTIVMSLKTTLPAPLAASSTLPIMTMKEGSKLQTLIKKKKNQFFLFQNWTASTTLIEKPPSSVFYY